MRLRSSLPLIAAGLLWNVQPVCADEIDRLRGAELAKSERLRLRAYGQALSTGQMPYAGLARMRQDMTRQGYYVDKGPLSQVARSMHVRPLLAWDGNINGGVLQDRFMINGLIFEADPEIRAQSGIVVGISVGGLLRYAWDEGRLVELRGSAEVGWSPEHDISRTDLVVSLCSRNHLAGWNFLDLCATNRRYWRNLGNASTDQASATFSKIFLTPNSIHEVNLSYSWESTAKESYNQLSISVESIWDRAVTEVSLATADPRSDAAALRDSASASVSWFAYNRNWSIDAWVQQSEGGKFLGTPRKDHVRGIGIATNLRPGASLRLGYLDSRSTAGIANYDQVTLDVRFDDLRW